jgi:HK97 family phage major capsid protein
MRDTKNQVAQAQALRGELSAARQNEKIAWNHFETVRAEGTKLGSRLLDDKAALAKLEAASKACDRAGDAVAAAQTNLTRSLMQPDSSDAPRPATPDLEPFISAVAAWAGSLSALDLGDTMQRMPTSPSFTLAKGRDMRAALTSASPTQYPARRPGVVTLPQAPLTLLDLLPIVPVDADEVESVRETVYVPGAAETAEGEAAPEAQIGYVKESVWCKNIAVYLPASKQVITERGRLRQFGSERLMRAVRERLQTQAIKGDGIAPNLLGIVAWDGILTHAQGTDSVIVDVLLKAALKLFIETKGQYQANTLLVHPNDFQAVALQRDGTSAYQLGTPRGEALRPIWGMAPVLSLDVDEGSPIVLDATAAELYANGDLSVIISDSHEGQFRRGIISFLASGRFALELLEPKAVCVVQLV